MIGWIIAAEVLFWIVLFAALYFRYILKAKKLSLLFFALTPVIDLVLLVLTALDLKNGSDATISHGLAAVYIGVSIAYGKTLIAWADEKFQKHVLKVDVQIKRLDGKEKAHYEIGMFIRHLVAYGIAAVLLLIIINYVGIQNDTNSLYLVMKIWAIFVAIDGITCIINLYFPKKQ